MSVKYVTYVEYIDTVSGSRWHGAIYPQFSRLSHQGTIGDSENITEQILTKVTVEDGRFRQASRRIGYTGQHTDLVPQGHYQIETVDGGIIITSNTPHIEIHGYIRNRYGGKKFRARLDCGRMQLQRPITRTVGDQQVTTWHDFSPTNYHD